ncbi:MAG: hypothetical protein NZ879_03315 [Archaeoglobaceae archaeon]|nr:hypothetical protein [Archaeoglobaceae archaeon]MDW8117997.1 hypothetical protein [Archaeoglobaceae archaeon]
MTCPVCNRKFDSEEALRRHLEECKAIERAKKEMENQIKLDSSGCFF